MTGIVIEQTWLRESVDGVNRTSRMMNPPLSDQLEKSGLPFFLDGSQLGWQRGLISSLSTGTRFFVFNF
ncbi:hypothetical protein [Ammoniphilus sp. YIM 78166]|uniref:hypothetical protein n=1 Tax=Ammoniphilus sp. YIM 78166 TaxID=1644106 RepID=UPI00142FDAE1|nr:hypothetical protein [Ammoniphilus sp. YIM 78166]